jgi:hypothetical protein
MWPKTPVEGLGRLKQVMPRGQWEFQVRSHGNASQTPATEGIHQTLYRWECCHSLRMKHLFTHAGKHWLKACSSDNVLWISHLLGKKFESRHIQFKIHAFQYNSKSAEMSTPWPFQLPSFLLPFKLDLLKELSTLVVFVSLPVTHFSMISTTPLILR